MTEPTLETLTQRLDRLERENHCLKLVGAVLLLALVAVGAMGQVLPKAVTKVVEAERFVLRDTRGKVLAGLDTFTGGPALSLYDQNGNMRARLGLLAMAGGKADLSLFDQNGKTRAMLAVAADGRPTLLLSDQNGKTRAMLAVAVEGRPFLTLADQNTKAGVVLIVGTSGPSLVLRDENSKDRAVLGHTELEATATGTVEQRPASSLVLFDRDGKVIWRAP